LYLLNDQFVHEQAAGLADRLLAADSDDAVRIRQAWQLLYSRPADSGEVDRINQYLMDVRAELERGGTPADQLEIESWRSLLRAMFRTNEFVYVD
jgi:hypothetical protein